MNEAASPIIYAILVFAVVLVIIITAIKRRGRRPAGVDGQKVGLFQMIKAKHESRTYKGVPYQYDYHPGSKNNPANLRLTFQAPSIGAFTLSKENRFDRFFKRMGICVEIDTHDLEFDRRFFITTNAVGFARFFFSHRSNREAAHTIFDCGFTHIVHDGKTMVGMLRPADPRYLPTEEKIEAAVAALITLTEKIPQPGHFSEEEDAPPENWKLKRFAAFAIPIVLGVAGVIALILGLIGYPPFDGGSIFLNSLIISIPALILFGWFAIQLVGGRSSSHRELMAITGIALGGFIMAGFGLELFLNGALDNTEAAAYEAVVQRTYYKKEKSDIKYFALVNSWREGRETERIQISKSQYNEMKIGETRLHIYVKPGKFGFPWLEQYHVAPSAAD